ncbi:MAG TPA: type VI secretion system contractile sheath large subunit [Polyangiaceae bacterium]|nr:type VI secretion system contractile sheath large subunit [Polyangiaceae bacterium]
MARLEFEFRFKPGDPGARRRAPGEPFRLLILADFSGRTKLDRVAPKPVKVDAEHLDRALSRFEARVQLELPGVGPVTFSPRGLEELHPDGLLRSLSIFQEPLRLRRAIAQGNASAEVLEQARAFLRSQGAAAAEVPVANAPTAATTPASAKPAENEHDTLARLLGGIGGKGAPGGEAAAPRAPSALQTIIERAVKPHLAEGPSLERDVVVRELDRVVNNLLQAILEDPRYRSLEVAWRGAERVVRALDTDEIIEIALLDLSQDELRAAFGTSGELGTEEERARAELVQRLPQETRYTCFAAALSFGPDDIASLAGLASWALRSGAFLLADAAPSLLGIKTPSAAGDPRLWDPEPLPALWHALRASSLGKHVGLVYPRVLLRLPYGKTTDPVEGIAFEEANGSGSSVARCFGSGALTVCEMLGRGYREYESDYLQSFEPELTDLPAYTYLDDGEKKLVPTTEVTLSERAMAACLEEGILPLIPRRDRASVQLPQLASLASPAAALSEVSSESA